MSDDTHTTTQANERSDAESGSASGAADASHGAATGAAGTTGTTETTGTTGGGATTRTFTEEFRVSGGRVVEKVKELVREGNVRRITLKNDEGKTLIEIPLTIGVIGTLLLPVWAGIGAIAALVVNLTIAVEKVATDDASADSEDLSASRPHDEATPG